jgi:hypothetical protein
LLAFRGAGSAASQRRINSIRYRYQVVDTEGIAASVAMKLRAARAEQRAAARAGTLLQKYVGTKLVVFDRQALKEGVASGAGGGVELFLHEAIMP